MRTTPGTRRVLVLAVHPERVASTRLRATQYGPALSEHGLDVALWSFFAAEDLDNWFGSSVARRMWALLRGIARIRSALREIRRADVVVVQREALPLGPPVLEWLASRRLPMVWDVDDAIWEPYESPTAGKVPRWLRAPGRKYERIAGWADEVWPGSEVLAAWCRRHACAVRVVPTVVDVPARRPEPSRERSVIWIGSHSTGEFLEAVLPALVEVEPPPRVIVVGADVTFPRGLEGEVLPWSQEAEAAALARARVGLYPVDTEHVLAEGKCGLKAILYLSRGIPPVVTPTATNASVVRDHMDGLHASSSADWTAAVQDLLDDDDLWDRCSRAGHARIRAHYSREVWAPRVSAYLEQLAHGR